jgi:N-formylglutamate amidohydrolase
LLARYHAPWHALLSDEADTVIGDHGQCWIIDAHSFPSVPLECEPAPHSPRPHICLGFDHVCTPGWCRAPLVDLWRAAGFTVAVNTPFAGALVPARHWSAGDPRVRSVMVEVHRRCYLQDDEQTYDARRAARVQAVMAPMLDLLVAGGSESRGCNRPAPRPQYRLTIASPPTRGRAP